MGTNGGISGHVEGAVEDDEDGRVVREREWGGKLGLKETARMPDMNALFLHDIKRGD